MNESVVDEILRLYREAGSMHYGEDVTQREHAVQVGCLAAADGQPDEVVVAAFLHDIGHLLAGEAEQMGGFGTLEHERRGAQWLRKRGFSETVARLVAGHVAAKRYLTAVDPQYLAGLSEASRQTLKHQGGPMNPQEVAAFESDDLHALHLRMRRWDEAGKDEAMDLDNLEFLRPFLVRHLAAEVR
jgi:phosphonate degradation associated HDIG domain protein